VFRASAQRVRRGGVTSSKAPLRMIPPHL
jgi:hypothetical protein